jgi:predicted RNase H-related nuclease YkuK (DUF458 family)
MFKSKFRKFTGENIPDIVEYIKDYIEINPGSTITVGCDSSQRRNHTMYAITIMMYDKDVRRGAHVVFFRETFRKIRDIQERLAKEAKFVYDVATYLDSELANFYGREDLSDYERKKYKYHLLKCDGKYIDVDQFNETGVIKNLVLNGTDLQTFKLVDIHVDFNPFEDNLNEKGVSKNKSNIAYKSYVPWLRGVGFRTWAKPLSHASSAAADLLVQ